MDDSQSSDFLSNSMDYSFGSPENQNVVPYDTLISKTKKAIDESIHRGITGSSLSHFTTLLEDCSSCITQSLDLIIGVLVDSEVHYRTLTEYMENAISLLQMLSNYINTIVECVALTCCTMKTFPVTTGNIVMAVFTHCRDSENLYGSHLKHVEWQLKGLFKTCHELQVTYLMVLEKHFTFDLIDKEEQEILIKALNINLAIGDIVQNLDVKTMAEQWKAYTNICDKHSSFLGDCRIFEDCTKVISNMTINNIKTALEIDKEDKIIIRSLKVASFIIKILLKLSGIFKHSSEKNYTNLLQLLIFINKHSDPYLEMELKKSTQFINQMNSIILQPSDVFLAELVNDEAFLQSCLEYDINSDPPSNKDELLGYVVLMMSVVEKMLQKSVETCVKFRYRVLKSIFDVLPKCHIYLSLGLKFKSISQGTYGLYEHVLVHTIGMASTLSAEDYASLEEMMYETILGTDCWGALLASDLWVSLSRNNRQLLIEQLVFLCKTYEKLESNRLFHHSPQKVHLTYTIARLFYAMKNEDRIKLYNRYNFALWTPVQIKLAPLEIQEKAVEDIYRKTVVKFERFLSSDVQGEEMKQMCCLMTATSTCRFIASDENYADYVVKIWMKSCPKNRIVLRQGELDSRSLWYLDYVEALVVLTKAMKNLLNDHGALAKILHVISNIAELRNTELYLVLLDLLCMISLEVSNENRNQLGSIISETYRSILQRNETEINVTLFRTLSNYKNHRNFEYVVTLIFSLDDSLQETFGSFCKDTGLTNMDIWKRHLTSADHAYTHKCVRAQVVEINSSGSSKDCKENSNNFDFADIDSLFEGGSDSEPASKKAKLTNESKIEEIISRLEKDSSLLSSEKENVFSKEDISRIQAVYNRLKNIID